MTTMWWDWSKKEKIRVSVRLLIRLFLVIFIGVLPTDSASSRHHLYWFQKGRISFYDVYNISMPPTVFRISPHTNCLSRGLCRQWKKTVTHCEKFLAKKRKLSTFWSRRHTWPDRSVPYLYCGQLHILSLSSLVGKVFVWNGPKSFARKKFSFPVHFFIFEANVLSRNSVRSLSSAAVDSFCTCV